jgi:nucleoside-diphosphate-sugar epimerase
MHILITGHQGYIGTVLVPFLQARGHSIVGLDSGLFRSCTLGDLPPEPPCLPLDVRDVDQSDLVGFDAIIHLAGVSNDPLGDLDEQTTWDINFGGTVRLAEQAQKAGVPRFLYASTCSVYGAGRAATGLLDEESVPQPLTPYARSKLSAERYLLHVAERPFIPVILRCATAYGASPRLRGDLVVNNLVGYACSTGSILIKSDGTAHRPLIHVEDICRAYAALLEAPEEVCHRRVFNVGSSTENYQVRQLAELVRAACPGTHIQFANGAVADARSYRVDFSRLNRAIPAFQSKWTVQQGIAELRDAFRNARLTESQLCGPQLQRIEYVKYAQRKGLLDRHLRWIPQTVAANE